MEEIKLFFLFLQAFVCSFTFVSLPFMTKQHQTLTSPYHHVLHHGFSSNPLLMSSCPSVALSTHLLRLPGYRQRGYKCLKSRLLCSVTDTGGPTPLCCQLQVNISRTRQRSSTAVTAHHSFFNSSKKSEY